MFKFICGFTYCHKKFSYSTCVSLLKENQMFGQYTMKKTNLKAKKQAASNSAKQLRLDSFFAKKLSPNKENLTNDVEPIDESNTSFICLSDIDCNEPGESSKTRIDDRTMDESGKILGENGKSCDLKTVSNINKRKLRSSPVKKNSVDEKFSVGSSKEELCKIAASPPKKKINLDKSLENYNVSESKKKVRKKLCENGTRSLKNDVSKTPEKVSIETKAHMKDRKCQSPRGSGSSVQTRAGTSDGSLFVGEGSTKTSPSLKKCTNRVSKTPEKVSIGTKAQMKDRKCQSPRGSGSSVQTKAGTSNSSPYIGEGSRKTSPGSKKYTNTVSKTPVKVLEKLKARMKNNEHLLARTSSSPVQTKAGTSKSPSKFGEGSTKTSPGLKKCRNNSNNSKESNYLSVKNAEKELKNLQKSDLKIDNDTFSENLLSKRNSRSPKKDRRSSFKSVVERTPQPESKTIESELFQESVLKNSTSLFKYTPSPMKKRLNSSLVKQDLNSVSNGFERNEIGLKMCKSKANDCEKSKYLSVKNASMHKSPKKSFINENKDTLGEDSGVQQNLRSPKIDRGSILKAVTEEAQRLKSKMFESELFQKSVSNHSSSLFQSTADQTNKSISPAKQNLDCSEINFNVSNSIIEGTPKPKSINGRNLISKDPNTLFQTSSKNLQPTPEKFVFKTTPKEIGSSRKAALNMSEPLFDDTPIKRRAMSVCIEDTPSKFSSNDSKSLFEESQSKTPSQSHLEGDTTDFNSVISATPQKMFEDSGFVKPVFKFKKSTLLKNSTRMFGSISPRSNVEPQKSLFEDSSVKTNQDKSSEELLGREFVTAVATNHQTTSESILNESDCSIVESSQVKQPWTMLKDTVKTETVNDQKAVFDNEFDSDLFFEDDWDLNEQSTVIDLALDTMKRCKIIDVKVSNTNKLITVQSCEDREKQTVCKLQGAWFYTLVEIKDIVNIVAEFKQNEWTIDNTGGLIILHPDVLISGTSLMGSMFCRRRAVLANSIQSSEPGAKCMVIGSLVHLVLQKVMKDNVRCEAKINKIIHDVVFDSNLVRTLLLSQMNFDEAERELSSFVPEILKFMDTYVAPTSKINADKDWAGEITSILDIEENIWSPTYGMKGKVDVTIQVKINGRKRIMPFELKTGKSSNSAEHRGQVILYVMMMSQLGYDVDSGLLFYLKDGTIKEVQVDYRVRRDIMMLRNDYVHYIALSQSVTFLDDGSVGGLKLPEPVDHHSACKRCPYQIFCCAALADDNMKGVHPLNPIVSLSETVLRHLKAIHVRYVFHWMGLLKVEEADKKFKSSSDLKALWCSTAEKREESGSCKANLSLSKVELKDDTYIHQFSFQSNSVSNNFTAGDYVIISSNVRTAVVTGFILNITDSSVLIGFEKDLSKRDEKLFHMDRYESQTLLNSNLSNLSLLLENTPQADQLRKSIIELQQPLFKVDRLNLSDKVMKKLNEGQKKAVLKAFAAETYMLIQGMPGCGKTETLATLVKLLVDNGQSVLVTSHTHSAVDNLALRLCDHVDLLRLGSKKKIHPSIQKFSEESQLSLLNFKSVEDIKKFYLEKKVVAVTVLGCSHPILSLRTFDVCIVDEATQVLQPSVIRPLMTARKFILVGDPLQLPPLVQSNFASSLGLSESLFVRLNRPSVTSKLNVQYRMNKRITALANDFMYDGALECANKAVASNTLRLNPNNISCDLLICFPWLKLALSCEMNHSVLFINVVEPKMEIKDDKCVNHSEAKCLMATLEALVNAGVKNESLGVIAPYRAQVNLLSQLTSERNFDVEVNTIDQYQGRDKEVILFSCTAHSDAAETGILSSHQRLSVAITRAKQKLIFFGDSDALKKFTTFTQLLEFLKDDCFVKS